VQHAQIVVLLPLLHYLAILEAADSDAFRLSVPPSGRAKVLRLPPVGAAYGVACDHLVSLCIASSTVWVRVREGCKVSGGGSLGWLIAVDVGTEFTSDCTIATGTSGQPLHDSSTLGPQGLSESVDRRDRNGGPTLFGRANTAQWLMYGGINQHLNARKNRASGTVVMVLVFANRTSESSIR
jgi:hypothetical protein